MSIIIHSSKIKIYPYHSIQIMLYYHHVTIIQKLLPHSKNTNKPQSLNKFKKHQMQKEQPTFHLFHADKNVNNALKKLTTNYHPQTYHTHFQYQKYDLDFLNIILKPIRKKTIFYKIFFILFSKIKNIISQTQYNKNENHIFIYFHSCMVFNFLFQNNMTKSTQIIFNEWILLYFSMYSKILIFFVFFFFFLNYMFLQTKNFITQHDNEKQNQKQFSCIKNFNIYYPIQFKFKITKISNILSTNVQKNSALTKHIFLKSKFQNSQFIFKKLQKLQSNFIIIIILKNYSHQQTFLTKNQDCISQTLKRKKLKILIIKTKIYQKQYHKLQLLKHISDKIHQHIHSRSDKLPMTFNIFASEIFQGISLAKNIAG
eukprot:TRINITY_DN12169_c0_g1_i5.p1 TRINITY_DN12169_c0_g1~~TRINITY_DN12169_c0_g1_i5.p1  ORF type:complete len:371 (+),score=-37.12 TRINITY_DN12169_c0_g1_i5:126-1238(+)